MLKSVLPSIIEVLFIYFFVLFCILGVERNLLSVFSGNLLAGDVHSNMTMDRHDQPASTYSLEVLSRFLAGPAGPTCIYPLT